MKVELEQGWYAEPDKKTLTRKRILFFSWFAAKLGFRRTKVADLYSILKRAYHGDQISALMPFEFPMKGDNFPKPDHYPTYFKLKAGWTIERGSVTFLKEGPLFSDDSGAVVVHSEVFVKGFLKRALEIALTLGSIIGLIRGVVWLFTGA